MIFIKTKEKKNKIEERKGIKNENLRMNEISPNLILIKNGEIEKYNDSSQSYEE